MEYILTVDFFDMICANILFFFVNLIKVTMIWLEIGFLLFQDAGIIDLLQICADGLGFTTPIPKLSWLFLVYSFAMHLDI